ncbi:MAG: CDP-alcohol phosphatidyltransferase family protein [Myxococcota bacterium]
MKLTANTVTILRILLLPLPCALFAHDNTLHKWIAFLVLVGLGCTDFVDGWLARAQGPTRLGALLDPVADKIFTASIVLLYMAQNMPHPALGVLILGREFMIVGLRGGLLARGHELPVSAAGKLKTVFQMGGFGTIFLTVFAPPPWSALIPLALALCFLYRKKTRGDAVPRRSWRMPVALALAVVALFNAVLTPPLSATLQAVVIVLFTWHSGVDYLRTSTRLVSDRLGASDCLRGAWAVTYAVGVAPWVAAAPNASLPLIGAVGAALTLGGVTNAALAADRRSAVLPFLSISTLSGCLFCIGAGAALLSGFHAAFLPLAGWLLCAVNIIAFLPSAVLLARTFRQMQSTG